MNDLNDLHEQVRAQKREQARRDFAAGKDRNSHGMNRGARAIEDYQAEWDRCAAEYSSETGTQQLVAA
jgi:hypothetical protein